MGVVLLVVAAMSLCASGGERAFLKFDTPLRFVFSKAENLEFHLPGVKKAIAAIPPESRPRDFYINCRAVRLDGSVSWKAYSAGSVSWGLPISQVRRVETLRMRPEIISMRKATGYDYRRLIPTNMLFGAAFLIAVDTVARNITTGEIPIGILTSFIGAPIFVYLILTGGAIKGD